MSKISIDVIEETLRKEVQKIDKRVQLMAVEPGKKKNLYRVTLLKDGKSGSADLEKEIVEQFLSKKSSGKKFGMKPTKSQKRKQMRHSILEGGTIAIQEKLLLPNR